MALGMGKRHLFLPYSISLGLPPEMLHDFCFAASERRCSSSGFHLTFPTKIFFPPQDREPLWALCQFLSMSVSIADPRTGKITTRQVQGLNGTTERWVEAQI